MGKVGKKRVVVKPTPGGRDPQGGNFPSMEQETMKRERGTKKDERVRLSQFLGGELRAPGKNDRRPVARGGKKPETGGRDVQKRKKMVTTFFMETKNKTKRQKKFSAHFGEKQRSVEET